MKKILSIFIIFSLFFSIFWNTFAINLENDDKYLTDEEKIFISKNLLEKRQSWKKYIQTIDDFLEKNESKEVLEKLLEKTTEVINSQRAKDEFNSALINYLYISAKIKLNNFDKEKRLKEALNPTIEKEDKEIWDKKISEIQNNIYNSLNEELSKISKEIKKELNTIDKWEFKATLSAKDKNENISWKLGISNIEKTTVWLDYETKAKIDFFYERKDSKNKLIDNLETKTDFENIQKNGESYFLLKNLIFKKNPENVEIKEMVEKLQKIFSENKYIKFWENNLPLEYEKLQDLFKNWNLSEISKNIKFLTEKNLFEVYKKEEDKYYLKPTITFCEVLSREKCSEEQFKKWLKEFLSYSEVYFTIKNNETEFVYKIWNEYFSLFGNLSFDKKEIKSFEINWLAPSFFVKEVESFNISYKKNSFLNIKSNFYNFEIDINWKLDNKNNFSNIDGNFKIDSVEWFIKYENYKLDIKAKNEDFLFKLDLLLDNNYIPKKWEIDLNISNVFKSSIKWENWKFNWETSFWNNYVKINHNWNISENTFSINDDFEIEEFDWKIKWNLKSEIYTKQNDSKITIEVKANKSKDESLDLFMNFSNFRNYLSSWNIEKPKNFIDYIDVFSELNNNYYNNYKLDDYEDYNFNEE